MLLGVLAGDRGLTAAGMVTYGAGDIAKDRNTDKTLAAQNKAIIEMQEAEKKQSDDAALEAELRREYGHESVDGLIALIDGNHVRAMALAKAGETSSDANHRVGAVWLEALVQADQGDTDALQATYERVVAIDPETETVEDADEWMEMLLVDMEEMRRR